MQPAAHQAIELRHAARHETGREGTAVCYGQQAGESSHSPGSDDQVVVPPAIGAAPELQGAQTTTLTPILRDELFKLHDAVRNTVEATLLLLGGIE